MAPATMQTLREHVDLLPLTDFYRKGSSNRRLPEIVWVEPDGMPQPYRELLVHDSDMTPTLERFHGSSLHIHVLNRSLEDDVLSREVVLHLGEREHPVEFGAIKIHLDLLPPEPRNRVLEGHMPLGGILRNYEVEHFSHPSSFIRVLPDAMMMVALGLRFPMRLYGRCNTLTHISGETLAEVVEILPPNGEVQYGEDTL
jgi:chorismate-pyruvate lyase